MSNSKKSKKGLLILGLLLMFGSIPSFIIANQKSKEAEEIRKLNEARAEVRESSANFNRTIGYVMLAGGAVLIVGGAAASMRK